MESRIPRSTQCCHVAAHQNGWSWQASQPKDGVRFVGTNPTLGARLPITRTPQALQDRGHSTAREQLLQGSSSSWAEWQRARKEKRLKRHRDGRSGGVASRLSERVNNQ